MKRKKKQNSLFVLFILIFLLFSCKKSNTELKIFSTLEKFDTENVYSDNLPEYTFLINSKISSAKFHSGKYSVVLDSINQFALNFKINLKAKTNYSFSFWKSDNKENLFMIVTCGKGYYKSSNFIIDEEKSGWTKVQYNFVIPDSLDGKEFECYIWNNSKQTVYVDDIELKTKKFDDIANILKRIRQINDTNALILTITEEDYFNLLDQKEKALKQGVLTSDITKWIKSTIIYKDTLINTKIRLKGDWVDFLEGDKFAFRVDCRDNFYFKGMKTFSLQYIGARHYLDQWLLYKFARENDILAPRYGFINVYLNEKFLGVYAYEEHFEKQMIESLKRREGPILKFNEESLWEIILFSLKSKTNIILPAFFSSTIEPFDKKVVKEKSYKNIYLIAQNLLFQHKYATAKVSDLFEVDVLAKYYALVNVFMGYHGLMWNNQRFYYNPITSKLQPIFFDNFIEVGIYHIFKEPILGNFDFKISKLWSDQINFYIFSDSVFTIKYIYYLDKYSQKSFWDSLFYANEDAIFKNTNYINEYYKNYSFDKSIYYLNAENIQKEIPVYLKDIEKFYKYNYIYQDTFQFSKANFQKHKNTFVNTYTQTKSATSTNILIDNYYNRNIVLIGYIRKNIFYPTKNLEIKNYSYFRNDFSATVNIESVSIDSLVFMCENNRFSVELIKWQKPTAWSPRQELEQMNKFPNEQFYIVEGKKVIFSGKQKISSIIYIPAGYNVFFEPGTEIDFVNNGAFMCYSSVEMNGTAQKPIVIKSTDKTAKGFTILQAPNVTISYTTFDGLDTWKYKGWELTGATTIYESRVKIDHCNFINNVCEDDLNIVRSYFEVTNSLFSNTFGDAFDSDFCDGLVDNCVFSYLGNDAIDFSTSKIKISNCKILNANDKGVSGGEGSTLTIENCDINGANIGIASKDKSQLTLLNINLSNTNYGFVLLQKKPEYGPGKIVANNIRFKKINKELLIEEKSVVILNNKRIDGFERRLAEKFY